MSKSIETIDVLAHLWLDEKFRQYLNDEKNTLIGGLKNIVSGVIERDAAKLYYINGQIRFIEKLEQDMKVAFMNINKLRERAKEKEVAKA